MSASLIGFEKRATKAARNVAGGHVSRVSLGRFSAATTALQLLRLPMVLIVSFPISSTSQTSSVSVGDGVFSVQQAARGGRSFAAECMDCHELPEFVGTDGILDSRRGESLWPVFDFMWSEMPEDRPAWLDPEEYIDILAYLLREYGMPSGDRDLQPDPEYLRSVRLDR